MYTEPNSSQKYFKLHLEQIIIKYLQISNKFTFEY